jgi:hypothetical protein
VLIPVPEQSGALPAEGPIFLIMRILVDVVMKKEGETNRFVRFAVVRAVALEAVITIPKHSVALPTEAPASLGIGVFREVMGKNEVQRRCWGLMVSTGRAESLETAIPK